MGLLQLYITEVTIGYVCFDGAPTQLSFDPRVFELPHIDTNAHLYFHFLDSIHPLSEQHSNNYHFLDCDTADSYRLANKMKCLFAHLAVI